MNWISTRIRPTKLRSMQTRKSSSLTLAQHATQPRQPLPLSSFSLPGVLRWGRSTKNKNTSIARSVLVGAGRGSRTPISTLARWHNSRYTIPAELFPSAPRDYQGMVNSASPLHVHPDFIRSLSGGGGEPIEVRHTKILPPRPL